MRKLSLSILAASVALIPSAALAQGGPPPGRPHGPPPGATWHGGGQMHGGQWQGGGQHFQRRLQRGFVVPPMWFGPQFHIQNWQAYGFANPGADARWVRYYDDAYLIGQDGRIRESREGLDWDRYGEQWEVADGVPAYRGSREYRPGDEDYAWSERSEHHEGHGGHMVQGGPGYAYGGGYGATQVYGGGYGYGMYAYPIVIETITTSGGGYSEEIVEEYVQVRHHARRARPRCQCAPPPRPRRPAPRPRPPAGERG